MALPVVHDHIDARAGADRRYLPAWDCFCRRFGYIRSNAKADKAATNNHKYARGTGK